MSRWATAGITRPMNDKIWDFILDEVAGGKSVSEVCGSQRFKDLGGIDAQWLYRNLRRAPDFERLRAELDLAYDMSTDAYIESVQNKVTGANGEDKLDPKVATNLIRLAELWAPARSKRFRRVVQESKKPISAEDLPHLEAKAKALLKELQISPDQVSGLANKTRTIQ